MDHHDVDLQEELGRALQERLKQLEHAQVGGHVKELAVLASHLFFFFRGGRFGPEHPVAALQHAAKPVRWRSDK